MNRDLVKILGFGVDSFCFEDALNYICAHSGHVVTINPEMISNALKDENFASVINNAELVIPDGIGVELGLKILGHNVKRIAGVEFGKALIKCFYSEGKSVAFVGARPEVVNLAVEKLKQEFQGLNVVYSHDGYFDSEDLIIEELSKASPDLVLVALGSPKQEFFISKLKTELKSAVMIGLGGSFDVWAGVVRRAPVIYQKLGLEWLYRTVKDPKRFKRIFPTLPMFVLRVILERLNNANRK
ncbi:WecB/TagA/CpsF family glycosyltransferase [bacterium]|nr:WecB/TagA/CpsF family glycosyltransferase [bacterium]